MVVYLDVLIIENFCVNSFLLYSTACTLRKKNDYKYLCISSLLGSFYVITLLFKELNVFTKLPVKIIIAYIMIMIYFRSKNFKFNIKACLVYILYSGLFAGICLIVRINRNFSVFGTTFDFSYKDLIVAMIILFFISNRLITFIRDRSSLSQCIFKVDIVSDNKIRHVKAFLDTGNELREPVTNLPVMIVDKKIIEDIMQLQDNFFYIPFKLINGNKSYFKAFKPEYIIVENNGIKEKREVIIAASENKIDTSNNYEALLSRGIM